MNTLSNKHNDEHHYPDAYADIEALLADFDSESKYKYIKVRIDIGDNSFKHLEKSLTSFLNEHYSQPIYMLDCMLGGFIYQDIRDRYITINYAVHQDVCITQSVMEFLNQNPPYKLYNDIKEYTRDEMVNTWFSTNI